MIRNQQKIVKNIKIVSIFFFLLLELRGVCYKSIKIYAAQVELKSSDRQIEKQLIFF